MFNSYRKQSREVNWGNDKEGLTIEQINCGSLLRIADSLEKMEKPYREMIDGYGYVRKQQYDLREAYEREKKRSSAYRKIIKRLKGAKNDTKRVSCAKAQAD